MAILPLNEKTSSRVWSRLAKDEPLKIMPAPGSAWTPQPLPSTTAWAFNSARRNAWLKVDMATERSLADCNFRYDGTLIAKTMLISAMVKSISTSEKPLTWRAGGNGGNIGSFYPTFLFVG